MSEHTNADPEVLTDHTDIICSTSTERIVTGRNAALEQIRTVTELIAEISALTRNIGGKSAPDWAMKQDFRCAWEHVWCRRGTTPLNLASRLPDSPF